MIKPQYVCVRYTNDTSCFGHTEVDRPSHQPQPDSPTQFSDNRQPNVSSNDI